MDRFKGIKAKLLQQSDMYCFYQNQYIILNQQIAKYKTVNRENQLLLDELSNENRVIKKQLMVLESILDNIYDVTVKEKKCCPICNNEFNAYLPFGELLRKNAQCPQCGSLERHRLSYLYLSSETNIFKDDVKLLHFAPESILADIFSKCANINYLPVDLFPGPNVKEQVDIQDIQYEDNSFDVIYCSHVLEHVPDDRKAMKELHRVLKPASEGSYAVIQVPINPKFSKTLENEEYNTPELRSKHYNQQDHLRYYGTDFPEKLKDEGFNVKIYTALDIIEEKFIEKYGIKNEEQFYICTKD